MKNQTPSEEGKENYKFILPAGPSDLCFDKNEFLEESFSADLFLQNHKRKASLETIRDDLGVYLKVLRSAMIELINKDYADFVNLSSNLIGLDKAIHNIHVPLGQLKEEILQVKLTLGESMVDVSEQLRQRRLLHTKKQTLSSLLFVERMLQKLENLVHNADKPLPINIIERAASEYNRLQFAISKCGPYKMESNSQKIEQICEMLVVNLNRKFIEAVKAEKPEEIAHCLRVYVILGKTSCAQELFRKEVIAVKLSDVICENYLNTNPNGLQGVYASILKILAEDMKHVVKLTCGKSCEVTGFDFVVNSFWPEVEYRLEVNLSSIYAPGNPEVFYKRFCETMQFLKQMEQYIGSEDHIKRLKGHAQYKAFIDLWNLPVYYQIRFQEIAGSLENTLSSGNGVQVLTPGGDFHVSATRVLWNCMGQCWADGIFLEQLGHRFWKLTLQLLARYNVWVEELLKEKKESVPPVFGSEGAFAASGNPVDAGNDSDESLTIWVCLYLDVDRILASVPDLEGKVAQKLNFLSPQSKELITRSLDECRERLRQLQPALTAQVVGGVAGAGTVGATALRQVSDIPRLFRRTNRDAPTRPCAYVAQALRPCHAFVTRHRGPPHHVPDDTLHAWLSEACSHLTSHYYNAVRDVITSVQKTEESLQRLKKFRDRSSATTFEIRGSDDDKIRKQLSIDVQSYSKGILDLGLKQGDVNKLDELITMVEDACNPVKDTK